MSYPRGTSCPNLSCFVAICPIALTAYFPPQLYDFRSSFRHAPGGRQPSPRTLDDERCAMAGTVAVARSKIEQRLNKLEGIITNEAN
jgi:hypothetical protein